MSLPLSSTPTAATATPAILASAEAFHARLSAAYALAQRNPHVFASPLGPFFDRRRSALLTRFVFFGPHASDDSWRLAFLGGFDHRDVRSAQALLGLVERLACDAEEGHGLNLSFFPMVDAAGLAFRSPERALGAEHWARSRAPEIKLLEKDARVRGYHGFVRLETSAEEDVITLRIREPAGLTSSPDVELISSEEFDPYPVRFERGQAETTPSDGPLSIADDLPVQPFELTLRIPAGWADALYHETVNAILTRFIRRYRALQAYGQHL